MRTVNLGKTPIVPGLISHWAVQVGNTWYELPGDQDGNLSTRASASLSGKVSNKCVESEGPKSKLLKGRICSRDFMGYTIKTDREIKKWTDNWVKQNPMYHFISCNCQLFAHDFVLFLTDNEARVPPMDSGRSAARTDESAWAIDDEDFMAAYAGTGTRYVQRGLAAAAAVGPNAGAQVAWGKHGYGAFANAEVGRAELSVAGVGGHVGLDVSTGIGTRNGNASVHILGTGVSLGSDGLAIDTPVAGVKAPCVVM